MTTNWIQRPAHRLWLAQQADSLLRFFRHTVDPDGRFVELDDDGRPLRQGTPDGFSAPQHLLTVARAVHSYALGELLGIPGCHAIVARGLHTMTVDHRDPVAGGYLATVGRDEPGDTVKTAYGHAFVLLAASSAIEAGHREAEALFDDVLRVIDERFWSEDEGAAREGFDRDWVELDEYRGANANMHLCESFLAAAEVAGRPELAGRAVRIAGRLIDLQARAHDWLLPEHYDLGWRPRYDYNRERPDDPFRPYGATVGHSIEWARLLLLARLVGGEEHGWFLEASEALFERAVTLGWDDRHGGLAYTVGWDGTPFNDDHYWWPIAEGIATAACLSHVTGNGDYEGWYRRFWDYASTVLIDHDRGGWYAEFDAANRRKASPWHGKPDIYHALQACLIPALPLAPSVAGAIRRSLVAPIGAGARPPLD